MGLEMLTWVGSVVSCVDNLMILVVFFVRAMIEINTLSHYIGSFTGVVACIVLLKHLSVQLQFLVGGYFGHFLGLLWI